MTLKEQVIAVVRSQAGVNDLEITQSSRLDGDLGLSSLDIVSVISKLESMHNVHFEAEQAEKIKTIGDLVNITKEAKMLKYQSY